MAGKKSFTVNYAGGVCVREAASKGSKVLAVLPYGTKVTIDPKVEAPSGWVALADGGFTMKENLN